MLDTVSLYVPDSENRTDSHARDPIHPRFFVETFSRFVESEVALLAALGHEDKHMSKARGAHMGVGIDGGGTAWDGRCKQLGSQETFA
jgi:hypothetical protein